MTSTLISIRLARVAVVGLAVVAVAGCASDGKKSDAEHPKKIERAASVKKEPVSSTTAPAPAPAASSGPACTTAAAQPAMSPDTVHSIVCEGEFAAGDASNTHVDYAYLLQNVNGSWQKASADVQNEVCTTNPQGLSANFVANACDD